MYTHTQTSIIQEIRNGFYLNICWDLKESLLHSLLFSLSLSCMAGLTGWQSWERQVGFVFLGTTPPPLKERKKMQDSLGKVHRKSHPFSTLDLTRNILHLGVQQFSYYFFFLKKAQSLLCNNYEASRGFASGTNLTPDLSHVSDNWSNR